MQIQGIPEEKLFAKIEFCIRNALLKEVGTTTKPGLVDLHDTGAHKDMDYDTFVKSTYAIKPYIFRMAVEGFHWNHELKNLFPHIREIGKQAEKAMFQATDGVNTHKGIIFTMGILATAAGYELKTNGHIDVIKVLDTAKEMVEDDMNRELEEMVYKDPETHGEEIYFQYGVKGIREEARSGFPVIRNTAYLKMRKYRICGYPQNLSNIEVLLHIMKQLTDTNVLSRGNMEELWWVQNTAQSIINRGGAFSEAGKRAIARMNRDCILKNISPGGAADMLAATIFLCQMEEEFTKYEN